MKILLVSTNLETGYPYPVLPLGVAYVSKYLRESNHVINVVDCCMDSTYMDRIQRVIHSFVPDVIGISMRNIDNCLFPNTVEYITHNKKVVAWIRKWTKAPIIVGGSAMGIAKGRLLQELDADWGYVGSACKEMVYGFEALALGKSPLGYNGFIGKEGRGQVVKVQAGMNVLSCELYNEIGIECYVNSGGSVGFQTKRGCDEHCIYCTYPVIEGSRIVCDDPKNVVKTIAHTVRKYSLRFFEFADSTFNNPLDHAKEICKRLIKERLDVGWTAFISPKACDSEFLSLCKRAGCTGLDLGIDSGSSKILTILRKGFTPDDIERVSALAMEIGIPLCSNLALGAPGECVETIHETFTLMEKIGATAVSVYSGIRVYPGTEMERIARHEGFAMGDNIYPVFYISPIIKNELNNMLVTYRAKHPEWMLRGLTQKPSLECITRFWKGRKVPLWADFTKLGMVRK